MPVGLIFLNACRSRSSLTTGRGSEMQHPRDHPPSKLRVPIVDAGGGSCTPTVPWHTHPSVASHEKDAGRATVLREAAGPFSRVYRAHRTLKVRRCYPRDALSAVTTDI
jgi:hypothetical protein